ncbi:MAG: NADH:ubiquinone reductase (Na(+)-transporting) subunit C [Clostridium sp.]|nr:NADH:ubiquinone reductase (Na(+)-transporting) subunit C [Clostridium sp.]
MKEAAVQPKKKGIDTNSNIYTIIYAILVVIIVAFLLAFVSKALEARSQANVEIDKKSQILAALNIRDLANSDVEAKYMEVVTADEIITNAGVVVKEGESKDQDGFRVENKEINNDNLPLYVCNVNGEVKYVLPMTGKGLWGGIWGYVALNADKNTVYGVYFSHESETAGLGALIKETAFQKQFENKKVLNAKGTEVALTVMKPSQKDDNVAAENRCDAVTGATLTSNGVKNMLKDCLSNYLTFLTTNE